MTELSLCHGFRSCQATFSIMGVAFIGACRHVFKAVHTKDACSSRATQLEDLPWLEIVRTSAAANVHHPGMTKGMIAHTSREITTTVLCLPSLQLSYAEVVTRMPSKQCSAHARTVKGGGSFGNEAIQLSLATRRRFSVDVDQE